MKKMPNKKIIQQRDSIKQSLLLDDYRDNPTKEILHKRIQKRKQREELLNSLEMKYDFNEEEYAQIKTNPKDKALKYNFADKTTDKLMKRFRHLQRLKNQLTQCECFSKVDKIPSTKEDIQYIYHIIETENMNGYDMYNMMHALQYQLRDYKEKKVEAKRENINKAFNEAGGIKLYLKLKDYLTDIGVNVHELH